MLRQGSLKRAGRSACFTETGIVCIRLSAVCGRLEK